MKLTAISILLIALLVSELRGRGNWKYANEAAAILRCTNLFSGATWDIKIDYRKSTADSYPATITDDSIKWHDVLHGRHYDFDRVSGVLTVIYASSTGGFFLKDTCHVVQR